MKAWEKKEERILTLYLFLNYPYYHYKLPGLYFKAPICGIYFFLSVADFLESTNLKTEINYINQNWFVESLCDGLDIILSLI